MNNSPHDFNLTHPEWRPGQREALDQLLALRPNQVAIVESACGSGKSAWAAATGSRMKAIVLTHTLALQSQYANVYGATKLMGRNNYPCVSDFPLFEGASATDCPYGMEMHKCSVSGRCPYLVQKAAARSSSFTSLNYSYANLTLNRRSTNGKLNWLKESLYCDEGHDLSSICLKHYELRMTKGVRERYSIEVPPTISSTIPHIVKMRMLSPWLSSAIRRMESVVGRFEDDLKFIHDSQKAKAVGRLARARSWLGNLTLVFNALRDVPDDWYIKSERGELLAKPLSAKHIFPKMFLFDDDARVVCMSATIGDFDEFAEELGIEDRRRVDIVVPSRYPPESRPIYVYDCPPMSYSKTRNRPESFEDQADIIAGAIEECPGDWSGLIHVTRKTEAELLRNRLWRRGLRDRVVASPTGGEGGYIPTSQQLEFWDDRKARVPNSILVSWTFGVGYDGLDERINISAKVPFLPFGSSGSYEEAYRLYSYDRYMAGTANILGQQMGRSRRGRDQDYDLDGEVRGLTAIVDGSFNGRISSKLPSNVSDSLVKV